MVESEIMNEKSILRDKNTSTLGIKERSKREKIELEKEGE
jgi:hypothetical protein